MESCSVGDMSVNYKILKLFRKDFWKDIRLIDEYIGHSRDFEYSRTR